MAELIIGAGAAGSLILLFGYVRRRAIPVRWWEWVLTLLGLLYGVFVLEVMVEFLREGTHKGAVVMGTLMGFPAVVWAVLLGRFVFRGRGERNAGDAPTTGGVSHV